MEQRRRIVRRLNRQEDASKSKQPKLGHPTTQPLPDRPAPFDQRYTRLTTYLENGLHDRIQDLNKNRAIPSITALVNVALSAYLDRHYPQVPH